MNSTSTLSSIIGRKVELHGTGPTFKGLCPFHDDHRPSFDVDPRRQRFKCWACGKSGDVISFVQEHERVSFVEALELLARRAGIQLEKHAQAPHSQSRAVMLDVVRWAAQQYHQCLLESTEAEDARVYLGGRGLKGETVRKYGLGFAPRSGEWLVQRAEAAEVPVEILEKVGLIAPRTQRPGYYDRFRDRVQFPIRDARGQTVGFGGRILPQSPLSSRASKYYNSTDTPLFTKSECVYGLDEARYAAVKAGYLAVVEGYTDVLMAHQMGVGQVVATMGTALNARHVQHLRRFTNRVVLIFDADTGGNMGVDRALEIFASLEMDLRVAMLPEGLDPCDLLVQQGPVPFRTALEGAVDVLDFKLNQVAPSGEPLGVEERRRAVDAVLSLIALAPKQAGQSDTLKTQLMVTRIARRLVLKEETVWARLDELRVSRRGQEESASKYRNEGAAEPAPNPKAAPEESELLQVLLAHPSLVPAAMIAVKPEEIRHQESRRLLEGLYAQVAEGESAGLDQLRPLLDASLAEKALKLQDVGQRHPDPSDWLRQILARFVERRTRPVKQEIQNQLHAASSHENALELLRQLQNRNVALGS